MARTMLPHNSPTQKFQKNTLVDPPYPPRHEAMPTGGCPHTAPCQVPPCATRQRASPHDLMPARHLAHAWRTSPPGARDQAHGQPGQLASSPCSRLVDQAKGRATRSCSTLTRCSTSPAGSTTWRTLTQDQATRRARWCSSRSSRPGATARRLTCRYTRRRELTNTEPDGMLGERSGRPAAGTDGGAADSPRDDTREQRAGVVGRSSRE